MGPSSIQVTVEIPVEVAGRTEPAALADEARSLLVLERCRRGELSPARSSRLLGLGRVAFLDLCAEHGIDAIRYDLDDFRRDLADIRALGD